jgi:hypothetical protein
MSIREKTIKHPEDTQIANINTAKASCAEAFLVFLERSLFIQEKQCATSRVEVVNAGRDRSRALLGPETDYVNKEVEKVGSSLSAKDVCFFVTDERAQPGCTPSQANVRVITSEMQDFVFSPAVARLRLYALAESHVDLA